MNFEFLKIRAQSFVKNGLVSANVPQNVLTSIHNRLEFVCTHPNIMLHQNSIELDCLRWGGSDTTVAEFDLEAVIRELPPRFFGASCCMTFSSIFSSGILGRKARMEMAACNLVETSKRASSLERLHVFDIALRLYQE